MRQLLCTLAMAMAFQLLQAQEKLDAFGKISKADLEMKTCDFEPDAEAVCLFDVGEVYYSISNISVDILANFRKRIKILKDKGVSQANIKIRYYSKDRYEDISNISGIVYNLDEAGNIVTTKLEKQLIYDKRINSRYSEISFALPNVKAGSVIEYKYKNYKSNNIAGIDDWVFQSKIPVIYSAYNLIIPIYFDFTYSMVRRQPLETFAGKKDGEGVWYIMRNVPSLKEEPHMAGAKDYLQRVEFQLAGINPPGAPKISYRTSWEKLSEELLDREEFGRQLNKNVPGTGTPLKLLLAAAVTDQQKMDAIYKFVQSNMSWNGTYSKYSNEGIKDAWDKKTGSTGDINLLLFNLLRDNNITAAPILVSTRDNGVVNPLYPYLDQFNAVYVYTEVDGKPYILNAADKYNPSSIYPYDVQLTNGFIVNKKYGRIQFINDPDKKLKHNVFIFASVDDKGNVSGKAIVNSFDYAKNIREKTYKSGGLKEMMAENEGIQLNIDSITIKNEFADSMPLEQNVYFNGSLQTSGEYTFLPYNLFSGLSKNPFVAEKRTSAIDFGYNQSYSITGAYNINQAFEVDELPRNIKMILPDSSIMLTRIIQKNDNILNFRITIDFLRAQYNPDEYPDVKEVFKKLFDMLSEYIVIKKKK